MAKVICAYEWYDAQEKHHHCSAPANKEEEGVWDGFFFVPLCDTCREKDDVLFCKEDEVYHFAGNKCPDCGKFE